MKRIFYLQLLLIFSFQSFGQDGHYSLLNYKCADNVERPYIVYTPDTMDTLAENPLLVYLHGAVSGTNLKKDPLQYMQKSQLIDLANKGGFYLMFSFGQKGATWFDSVGVNMVLGEIEDAANKLNIDKNKIFLSGFSDGGSGVLYFSMTKPLPFAGFIAMNGSVKVAQKLGQFDLFPENTNQKPMLIINTKSDMLYPINQIDPTIDYLKKFNKNVSYKRPDGNHEMAYLATEQETIISFIKENSNENLKKISWETSSIRNNLDSYLSISKLDTTQQQKEWHNNYALKVFNDKAYFGLKYDYQHRGKGLKVKGFKNDTCTAVRLGVEVGDVILMMEKDTLKSPYSPFYYKSKKKAGDKTSLTLLRNDKELKLSGTINKGYYYNVFNNKYKSGKLDFEVKGKKLIINTSRIKEITLNTEALRKHGIKRIIVNGEKYRRSKKAQQTIVI